MRNTNQVFSAGERRGAMWVVIAIAIIVGAGAAYDRIAGPSLGMYGDDFQRVSMPGVQDATPLS